MSVPKREAELKRRLLDRIHDALPRFVVIPHVDAKNGVPDWSVTGNGFTSWLEFKHATPAFASKGIQVLTARRLAAAGHCRYVVFWECAGCKMTYIVHPREVQIGRNAAIAFDVPAAEGFDFNFVIDHVRKVHGL